MKQARVLIKFVLFFSLTFGIYSLWFGVLFCRSQKSRLRLREFIFRNWARGFARISRAQIEIVGVPPRPPFLLVSNHLSYFDIAALRSIVNGVFVAKAEIESWPIAGTMVRNMGMIFVNREQKRDIPRAGAEMMAALARGEGVIIFAEGTTSDGREVLPFKSSFFEFAATNEIPVYFASVTYKTRDGELPASEAICWWREEEGFLTHLFKFFALSRFSCTVTFGAAPIICRNRKDLANELWRAVNQQFVPVDS